MDWYCLLLAGPFVLLFLVDLVLHATSYFKELSLERELKKDLHHILTNAKNVNRA